MTNEDINSKKMIYSTSELKAQGFSYYLINQMVKSGKLKRLNKQNYENKSFNYDYSDYFYVGAFAKNGVVCLLSAASYYALTSYRCDGIDVAIERKTRLSSLPGYPRFNIHYYTEERLNTGVVNVNDGYNSFMIYDMEKTVADIIYYREKVGIEETKEILINYLNRKDRNLNKLIRYAKKLKCYNTLSKYLEVLV